MRGFLSIRAWGGLLLFLILSGCARVPLAPAPPDLPPPTGVRPRPADPPPTPTTGSPAPLPTLPAAAPLPALTLPSETGNVRAVWIVRTALAHPDSARAAVRRAGEAGFNTLFVQVRGRGDAYYDSRWEPPPEALQGDAWFDPLAVVLNEARVRGLRVHAWVNVHLVASATLPPRDPRHLTLARPELLAVPRALAVELFDRDPRDPAYLRSLAAYALANPDRIEGIYTNPAHPRVQDHITFVVADLVERYPLDGVHFDYLRFPSPDFDFSRPTLESFRRWVQGRVGAGAAGAELRWPQDPLAYVAAFPDLWTAFRTEQISLTMERLYREVKAIRPGTVVSAAVFADADDARRGRFQDWEGWLAGGFVDLVAPMAYTPSQPLFEAQLRRATALDPRRVWIGLGIYQDSFAGAVAKGRLARSLGAGGIALFSYDWAVGSDGTRAAGGSYLSRFALEVWGAGY